MDLFSIIVKLTTERKETDNMVYALWKETRDTEHLITLLYGEPRDIMNRLIDNANMLIDEYRDGMEIYDIYELSDMFIGEFDSYIEFWFSGVPVTIDDLKSYRFTISDFDRPACSDSILIVASNFRSFVEQFNEHPPIKDLFIKPDITEKELDDLCVELESYEGGSLENNTWLKDATEIPE